MKGEEKSMGRLETAQEDDLLKFEFEDLKVEEGSDSGSSDEEVIDLVEIVEEGVVPPKMEGAFEEEVLVEEKEEEVESAQEAELTSSEDELQVGVGLTDSIDQEATQSLDLELDSVAQKEELLPEEGPGLEGEEKSEDLLLDLEDLEGPEETEPSEDLEALELEEALEEELDLEEEEEPEETLFEEEELEEAGLQEEVAEEETVEEPELPASLPITEEKIEEIVSRVVGDVVERVVRETVAEVAEKVIGEAIEALKQSLDEMNK